MINQSYQQVKCQLSKDPMRMNLIFSLYAIINNLRQAHELLTSHFYDHFELFG